MENVISQLLQDFENGKMSRRQLIQSLALAATAASVAEAASGFKTIALDHISYQVVDYKKTRDFYKDLMGMTVSDDNGNNQGRSHRLPDRRLEHRQSEGGIRSSATETSFGYRRACRSAEFCQLPCLGPRWL
jgi:Glyoxalase/Bleomycin resistance protein/Dioxygenase superfamily